MAQFTINIPDDKLARILKAFGRRDPVSQQWIDATPAEIRDLLKAFLRSRVVEGETAEEALVIRNAKSVENWE